MKYNLDATDDYSFKELYSYLSVGETPAYVKQAEVVTKEAISDLPNEAFADRYHRAFPIDSAPNVFVSNAFFVNKKAEIQNMWGSAFISEVEDRLGKAAELFGIKEDIDRYNNQTLTKAAQDYTEDFVVSFKIGDKMYELFPYKTAEDLTKAAEQFSNNIKNYPFNWRTTIASNFIKKAEGLGIDELPDLVCKYGGMYFPDTRLFQGELTRRMNKFAKEEFKEKYKTCVEKAASISSRAESFDVCAEAYAIEKAAGVYDNAQMYRQFGDIIDKTFTLSMFKMAELLNVIEMAGEPYSIEDLQKVSKDIYKQAFDFDIDPADVSALKEILPTAPRSDIALFRELSGIKPL